MIGKMGAAVALLWLRVSAASPSVLKVYTQGDLTAALADAHAGPTVIELGATIILTAAVVIEGQAGLVVDGLGKYALDGQQRVQCVVIAGSATEVTLQNLTITGGLVHDLGSHGFGLSISAATVAMHGCRVTGNGAVLSNIAYGAGVFITDAAVVDMVGCTVSNNTLYGSGAGVCIFSGTVSMVVCTIANNVAFDSYGGGLYVWFPSLVTMTSCAVVNNTATGGADIGGDGGGLYMSSEAAVLMTSCTLAGNSAMYYGGGVTVIGQYASSTTFPWLMGCTFDGNSVVRNQNSADVWANHLNSPAAFPEVLSACAAGAFNVGSGALVCKGCDGEFAADLSGACTACPVDAPFSCCGALSASACSAALPASCSDSEIAACGDHA